MASLYRFHHLKKISHPAIFEAYWVLTETYNTVDRVATRLGQPIKAIGFWGLINVKTRLANRMKKGDFFSPPVFVYCTGTEIERIVTIGQRKSLFDFFIIKAIKAISRRSGGIFFLEGRGESDDFQRIIRVSANSDGCLSQTEIESEVFKSLRHGIASSEASANILRHVSGKIHFYGEDRIIYSSRSRLIFECESFTTTTSIPGKWYHNLSVTKALSRLLRSDQINLMYDGCSEYAAVMRDGRVHKVDLTSGELSELGRVRGFRGLMHNAHCFGPDGKIYFGEYGRRASSGGASIYCVDLNEASLTQVSKLPVGKCKHIHCLRYDEFTDSYWICTGDENSESRILRYTRGMEFIEEVGGNSQIYRTCDLIFAEDEVRWLMDSPLQPSSEIIYDRKSKTVCRGVNMPGPVWYAVNVNGVGYFCSVADEPCCYYKPKVTSVLLKPNSASDEWSEYFSLEKDWLPYVFKYASIELGSNSALTLYCNFQATSYMDGVGVVLRLDDKNEN